MCALIYTYMKNMDLTIISGNIKHLFCATYTSKVPHLYELI